MNHNRWGSDLVSGHWLENDGVISNRLESEGAACNWLKADGTITNWLKVDRVISNWLKADRVVSDWLVCAGGSLNFLKVYSSNWLETNSFGLGHCRTRSNWVDRGTVG